MAAPQDDGSNDEAWARAEGIPSIEQPFIQKYLDGRDALVAQEKRQRSDHAFRETLSPMAAEAAAIVSAIRFQEQQTLWHPDLDDELAKTANIQIYPGMMFQLAKERMESSKLWQIVKKMPKGALLHCHLEAMGDTDWQIEQAFTVPGMCIISQSPMHTSELRSKTPFLFRFATDISAADTSSIWSESYRSNIPIPVAKAADSFPDGGKEGFVKWLKSRVTIGLEESTQHHLGPNAIWERFRSCFGIVGSLQRYEPIFKGFIRNILQGLHRDGVRWVDLRTVFLAPFYREGSTVPDDDFENMLAILEEEIEKFKASDEGKGFWGAKMIWTSIRQGSTRAVAQDMKQCIAMKALFPDLIAGYDLVGQEDHGRPLVDLTPELFWFKKQCAEAGVDIPFYFHAGETAGDGDTVDENLFDAVLLGTRRIGHGFSLYKHPLLCEMVKDKRILVESCPISNEVLRLTSSIMSHPLPALLARGVPCALSNDDPSMLGQVSNGLSHDFWQALQGWENLGLEGLASLAENSVRWASFDDCTNREWAQEIKDGAYGQGTRAERMRQWAQDFEAFCQWVVLEFGADTDINTLD